MQGTLEAHTNGKEEMMEGSINNISVNQINKISKQVFSN